MAKLTLGEVWAIAKGEPLYRLAALIFVVVAAIYVGVQLAPFWGVWRTVDRRPRPAVEGMYGVGDDCFSFANLPKGWRPARQALDGREISIERRAHGFHVIATLVPRDIHADTGKDTLGDLNYDAEVTRHNGIYIICSTSVNFGWRPDDKRCFVEDQTRPGKYGVQVAYEKRDKRYAEPLLNEANSALRSGLRSCARRPAADG